MAEPDLVAVQATEERFFTLTHQPDGTPLDALGAGAWPADQFTFALIREGALKRPEQADEVSPDAKAPAAKTRS